MIKKSKYCIQSSCVHYIHDGRGTRDVYLNNQLIKNVFLANTQRGYVVVAKHDEHGNVMLDQNGQVLRHKLRGKVVVKFRENNHVIY